MNHLTIAKKFAEKERTGNDCFEEQYILLRQKEGRLYPDEVVLQLPTTSTTYTQHAEWQVRKRSCNRLLTYIRNKKTSPDILEIGCGNGWLSAQLAGATNGKVTGLDVNYTEIDQARRVFRHITNCRFVEGDILEGVLAEQRFDLVVFAASIQYFKSLKDILNCALEHLTLQGEIHIIDSKFYRPAEVAAAQQRSIEYFNSMGFPAMAAYYHHHTVDQLNAFEYRLTHDPNKWWNKYIFRSSPFHRVIITNRYR